MTPDSSEPSDATRGGCAAPRRPTAKPPRDRAWRYSRADVEQEAEARAGPRLRDLRRDLGARAHEAQRREAFAGLDDRHGRDLDDGFGSEHDGARLGAQALAVARAAVLLAEVLAVPLTRHLGRRLLHALLDRVDDAREAHGPRPAAVLALPRHLHALVARPEQQHLAVARREALPRLVERDAELLRHGGGDVRRPALVASRAVAPRLDGAVGDRQIAVRHDQVGVDLEARAEAVAVDAHAERAVERERLRRQLGQAHAAVRARARLAVGALARLALDGDQHRPAADLDGRLDGVREARALARVDAHAIDDDLDRVLLLLVEGRDVLEALDEAVDAHAREAGLARLLEHLAELALSVLGLARHERRLRLRGQREQLVDDLGWPLRAATAARRTGGSAASPARA